jgi:hypothetical protein
VAPPFVRTTDTDKRRFGKICDEKKINEAVFTAGKFYSEITDCMGGGGGGGG